ncbi:NAD(P)-dependent oxidoreductase [Enterococcus rivorum]|uniref:NAD(P)-binding domain-containing protein n=1 Tax=Enterococcus rivorum TaxID=762845 RepID=A0A1E5KXN7_9ENTE|nr:NAD(P)-dependent oxidoreductase [Enterococcus rivorum]MBP2099503.1 putative NADH-flavin reductase [Enterococcus rivorum]OEH82615.1 hypothetical protein BCR26_12800 [Enterococcus rivorum]
MKIAILGANGKAGSLILKEAQKRGLEVTAIVRNVSTLGSDIPVVKKNIYQLTSEDVEGFDVLVSALGFWQDVEEFTRSTQHLIAILKGQKTRLLVVGGAGSLYVDKQHHIQLKDTPDFPEAFKPLATAMGKGLDLLKAATEVHWTYISPAAEFDAEGVETGEYSVAGEEFTVNAEGKSYISYADYAIAMLDEIQSANHPNQRISVYQ